MSWGRVGGEVLCIGSLQEWQIALHGGKHHRVWNASSIITSMCQPRNQVFSAFCASTCHSPGPCLEIIVQCRGPCLFLLSRSQESPELAKAGRKKKNCNSSDLSVYRMEGVQENILSTEHSPHGSVPDLLLPAICWD